MRFFTSAAQVLFWIALHPDTRVSDIAERTGLSQRAVQAIVKELADRGYIVRSRIGRRNTYSVVEDHPLHPDHPDGRLSVGDLLSIVGDDHPWRTARSRRR